MTKTHQLNITLPEDIAIAVKERVASGEYISESEVIRNSLEMLFEHDASPHEGNEAYETWLRTEVMASIEEYRADPSNVYSLKQMREELDQWHAESVAERQ